MKSLPKIKPDDFGDIINKYQKFNRRVNFVNKQKLKLVNNEEITEFERLIFGARVVFWNL